jgi:calreticulin
MLYTLAVAASIMAYASAEVYFKETFDASWEDRWVVAEGSGPVDVVAGDFYGDVEADAGLHTAADAKFYHVGAAFPEFSNKGKDLVVQFSVKHQQNIDCGGGYLKFFPAGLDLETFDGDSDYNIMFGPDICGSKKVHVIFNYKGENFLISKTISPKTDIYSHVYTLRVSPDQTYEVFIDGQSVQSGSLLEDWSFLPPAEINDPEQSKPEDWVDEAMIDDPEDVKPEGYDDIPEEIVDPEAEMPEDWDEEDDGEWEAPVIPNPEYKGPWFAKRIANPDYVGEWEHPQIPNPEYEEDTEIYAYDSFGAVGLDVWQVKSGSIFDNIIITDSLEEAEAFREETHSLEAEKAMKAAADEAAADAEEDVDEEEDFDDLWDEEETGHDEL